MKKQILGALLLVMFGQQYACKIAADTSKRQEAYEATNDKEHDFIKMFRDSVRCYGIKRMAAMGLLGLAIGGRLSSLGTIVPATLDVVQHHGSQHVLSKHLIMGVIIDVATIASGFVGIYYLLKDFERDRDKQI